MFYIVSAVFTIVIVHIHAGQEVEGDDICCLDWLVGWLVGRLVGFPLMMTGFCLDSLTFLSGDP